MAAEELSKRAARWRRANLLVAAGIAALIIVSPDQARVWSVVIGVGFVAIYILPFALLGAEVEAAEEGLLMVRLLGTEGPTRITWDSIVRCNVVPFPPPWAVLVLKLSRPLPGGGTWVLAWEIAPEFVRNERTFEGLIARSIRLHRRGR